MFCQTKEKWKNIRGNVFKTKDLSRGRLLEKSLKNQDIPQFPVLVEQLKKFTLFCQIKAQWKMSAGKIAEENQDIRFFAK